MNAKEAVARRIQELCVQRGLAINALANLCGVPPSTIYSMLNAKSQNPGIISIQKICDGLEISVREFFDDPLFENLDPIVQYFKSIVQYQTKEYGCIKVKLAEVLERRGITRNRLRTLTGTKYDVIDRYYKGVSVEMADLDFLAKVCYVLDCEVSDLLEYQRPEHK